MRISDFSKAEMLAVQTVFIVIGALLSYILRDYYTLSLLALIGGACSARDISVDRRLEILERENEALRREVHEDREMQNFLTPAMGYHNGPGGAEARV